MNRHPETTAGHVLAVLDALERAAVWTSIGGGAVDVHPLRFLADDSGTIGGRAVRCFAPERQRIAHAGYEPEADDRWDLDLLGALSL